MPVRTARSFRPARPRRGDFDHAAASSSMTLWIVCGSHSPSSRTISPSARKSTRCATAAARASWVTITIVWPYSSTERRRSSRISPLVAESRFPVGSSAKSTVGFETSARAIATRCCCPPESSDGPVRQPVGEPDVADQLVEPAVLRLLAGDGEREEDVLLRVQHRQEVEELEHEADVLAPQLREVVVSERRDLRPGDLDIPGRRLVEPREDVHQRRLPRARGPHHRGRLARRDVRRTRRAARPRRSLLRRTGASRRAQRPPAPFRALRHSRLLSRDRGQKANSSRTSLPRDATGSPERRFPPFRRLVTVSAWRSPGSRSGRRSNERARRRRSCSLRSRTTSSPPGLAARTAPLVWDYARIANFEELWLLRNLNGDPPRPPRDTATSRTRSGTRAEQRPGLALLRPPAVRAYAEDVRDPRPRRARARRSRRTERAVARRVRLRTRRPERAPAPGDDAPDAPAAHRSRVPGAPHDRP